MKTIDIELALAEMLDYRRNIVVPNVSWGMLTHECDILSLTQDGYATEYEIKISPSDLKRDSKKHHMHLDGKIKNLYFVMPRAMATYVEYVPERAGIIFVDDNGHCSREREAKALSHAYKFNDEDRFHLARLGAMRVWGLKRKLKHSSMPKHD